MARIKIQPEVAPDEVAAPETKAVITPALRHPEYDPTLPDNKQRHTL